MAEAFKSPVEYSGGLVGFYGYPCYYIDKDEIKKIYVLKVLNTDTLEYEEVETSSHFSELYPKALQLSREIMDRLNENNIMFSKEADPIIEKMLKEQIERGFKPKKA